VYLPTPCGLVNPEAPAIRSGTLGAPVSRLEAFLFGFSSQSLRRSVGALSIATISLIATAGSACAWQTAHGNPDNSGTVDVSTAPAVSPLNTVRGLGGIAPGVVPVIAPNGTLYIGNARGKLMTFSADGQPGWNRDVGSQAIMSAPVLGNDGSVYVVGTATIRDRRTNPPTITHIAELHKFTSSGGWAWHVPLPVAGAKITSSSPNVARVNGKDVIFVPTIQSGAPFNARLTAISEDGGILASTIVASYAPQTTGGSDADFGDFWCEGVMGGYTCTFASSSGTPVEGDSLAYNVRPPVPAVAVHNASGGAPTVMMSGGFQDLVGLAFTGAAFEERFRVHDEQRFFNATPLAWPDGHAMINANGHEIPSQVVFAGFNMGPDRAAGPTSIAAPTALGNSRFAIVHRTGGITIMRGGAIEKSAPFAGHSIASAAASTNHIFVSTATALHTFDKNTLDSKGTFAWQKGGTSQPVIGPQGHVYAIAGDGLLIFPPVVQSTNTPNSPTSQTQAYKPPLTANGNRLFACEKLDGDDCGKGDYRSIAKAFCAKNGFTNADDLDVDSKKVKAETLDGQFCSKNKCKVFDQIVCRM
jgi:hypothetical protein